MGTFMGVAGIYVFLGADFVAAVQVLIYVGGILVLILFAVMLTHRITDVEVSNRAAGQNSRVAHHRRPRLSLDRDRYGNAVGQSQGSGLRADDGDDRRSCSSIRTAAVRARLGGLAGGLIGAVVLSRKELKE